jgi:hypothetical protein
VNVPRPVQPIISDTQPALDANKRKQLPAWIREGKTLHNNLAVYCCGA